LLPPGLLLLALAAAPAAAQPPPVHKTPQDAAKPQQPPPEKKPKEAAEPPADEAERALQEAVEAAGNDQAALLRNLEEYLKRFPDAPRKTQVYRALVEAAMQLRDRARALDYAERIIALHPEDSAMMLFAVDLLEELGGDRALARAVGYISRVLDRVEKIGATGKPARIAQADWDLEQQRLRMSVLLIRGRLAMRLRDYEAAVADLAASFELLPNAAAAVRLGEIAEIRRDYAQAIEHYVTAFVLPENYGAPVDRREVRRKLGNVWQIVHGNEEGLGPALLAAYDRAVAKARPAQSEERNREAKEPYAFVLRRLDGSDWNAAAARGKVLVLNFWATWCLPCRELEPLVERVEDNFRGRDAVLFFAVNTDQDEARVKPYLEREKLRTAVVFADGLDRLLAVRAIPAVVVLDREGKIVFRSEGFSPDGFVEALTGAIERALGR
jgi:thiol-disulfide isomerase/thioredoxin